MEIDFSIMRYEDCVEFIFNRPVTVEPWSDAEVVFEPAEPTQLIDHLTKICLEFSSLRSRFSWEQIDQGVWAILDYPMETVDVLMGDKIPQEPRLKCIASMFNVYSETVANVPADVPMETCFSMWWDIVARGFCWRRMNHWGYEVLKPTMNEDIVIHDTMFETLVKILSLDDDRCQMCALHGLGHLHHEQGASTVQRFMCGIPSILINEVKSIPGDCVIDGESIGEVFWAFDILSLNGDDLRALPYKNRLLILVVMLKGEFGFIKLADTAHNTERKRSLLERMKREHREGVVLKNIDAPYTAGRPNSGGPQLKHKFYATASFIVWKVNAKRSVCLALWGTSKAHPPTMPAVQVTAGNVTIPANHQIPKAESVVEVRYLYAFKESGIIYQPVYLGQRSDIDPSECRVEQLKYKAEQSA